MTWIENLNGVTHWKLDTQRFWPGERTRPIEFGFRFDLIGLSITIASVAAPASPALSPDVAHDSVSQPKHKLNARALAAVALFGFLEIDVPSDAKLIGEHAKTVGP